MMSKGKNSTERNYPSLSMDMSWDNVHEFSKQEKVLLYVTILAIYDLLFCSERIAGLKAWKDVLELIFVESVY